jgi:hypothetical protein
MFVAGSLSGLGWQTQLFPTYVSKLPSFAAHLTIDHFPLSIV